MTVLMMTKLRNLRVMGTRKRRKTMLRKRPKRAARSGIGSAAEMTASMKAACPSLSLSLRMAMPRRKKRLVGSGGEWASGRDGVGI